MENDIEIGLEYIRKMGIHAARNPQEIFTAFEKKFGKGKGGKMLNRITTFGQRNSSLFYNRKNEKYETSMLFTSLYDADIIRKACNWVAKNSKYFGKRILEIGCDCGLMTCFLASFFPEKHIVALDQNQSGINIAKKNVEKLGCTNVEFVECDINSYVSESPFDTIFSMRVAHEVDRKGDMDVFEGFQKAGAYCTHLYDDYSTILKRLLTSKGTLLSIERMQMGTPMTFGWIDCLMQHGFHIETDSFEELKCKEVGDDARLPSFVACMDGLAQVNSFDVYKNFEYQCIKLDEFEYWGWEAKMMFEFKCGNVIKGVKTKDDCKTGRYYVVVATDKDDDNKILALYTRDDYAHLDVMSKSRLDEVKQAIDNVKDEIEKLGNAIELLP